MTTMSVVKKAVFPVAGLGTRFLPATKVLPKEMLILVDRPVIQYGVEEATASGIDEVVLVTSPGKKIIEDHFEAAVELEGALEQRDKTEALQELREMSRLARVRSVLQNEPLGLGHAVLMAQPLVGNEPFAVVLCDDVFDATPPALTQMIAVFDAVQGPVIAVERVPEDRVSSYGIVDVADDEGLGQGVHRIRDLVEKPSPDAAPSNLAIIGRYILTPDVFAALEVTGHGSGGEIQLTDALKTLLKDRPLYAFEVNGVRHDTGNKEGFLKATAYYANRHAELAGPFRDYVATLTRA
jgi:UTP--glucose-1-phosphate uridylyltransferase